MRPFAEFVHSIKKSLAQIEFTKTPLQAASKTSDLQRFFTDNLLQKQSLQWQH